MKILNNLNGCLSDSCPIGGKLSQTKMRPHSDSGYASMIQSLTAFERSESMNRIQYLMVVLLVIVFLVISCSTSNKQKYGKGYPKPAHISSKQKYGKGYPKPAHISSAKYPSVDQLYLGKKLPLDQIALIGTFTWVNGNNKIKLKSIRNTVTGEKWIVPKGSSGFHGFLETQPGTYELFYNDPFSGESVHRILSIAPGETYALYPDQIKPEGKIITQTLLSKESSRYILLPYIDNLKDSRFITMLCGWNINSPGLSMSMQEFRTFHIDHSSKDIIENGIGKPVNSQKEGGLELYEYQSQIYKTELEKRSGEPVSSNSKARSIKLAFDKTGILKKIIVP